MTDKLATWHADMFRKGRDDAGRHIEISIPRDLDDVELIFLDELWRVVRKTVGRMSHKRLSRKAVPADFGIKFND